ncbi:MAG: lytic transglycosylase domain-containing protein [Myxococcales bacterium]|nr:MAG: lytic transglycosylase domain-containing protein [Myxococcales bacterium]
MRRFWLGASVVWLVCAWALAEGGLERIASLVRAGDEQEALGAIATLPEKIRDEDSLRYLRGRLLLAAGRPCDAMEALAQSPSTLPESMRVDSMRRWAWAAARCGHCEEARPVLLGVASSDVTVTRRDRAVAADCAVQMGELEIAAQELQRLTRRKGGVENRVALLALLSDVYAELGRPEEARQAALDAWKAAVHPGQHRATLTLEERASPTTADRIDRAEELMGARRFAKAVEELEAIDVRDDAALNAQWHHVYGMALFRMRTRYLDAARILYRSSLLRSPHEAEDAFHSARALSRADKDARAIRAYRRFAQRYPKNKRTPEARFLAAWLEIRLGRANGEKQMERLVRGRTQVRGRWRRSALWELGFRAFETRRYARAARYLSQYTKLATSSMDEARGYYWQGRSYRRGPKAVEAYREAIRVEPLHWYAVLAANRLKRLKVEPPDPFEGAPSPSSVEVPEHAPPLPETFAAYRRLGLDVDGIAWLSAHESSLVAELPKAQRIPLLAQLYRDAGAYREALGIARRRMVFLQSDPAEHRWWWDAAYPMPWLEVVDAHRGALPRALVYATMRQESGFLPNVVSRAGAVGLMQVMPELAQKLTGERVTRQMLRAPQTNIAIGLQEMTALAEELDHVYPLSIAAYNAGKSRVRRWLRESGKMELDRFVERIPFNETRNYVRRVTTHYARYAYLDDSETGWPRLPRFVNP